MLSIIRQGTAVRRWPDPVRAWEVMEQSESDHQLDLLDLGPFVLLNLQAEAETDNSVEFVINQDFRKENTKSRRGRPCAKPPSQEILTRRRNVGGKIPS